MTKKMHNCRTFICEDCIFVFQVYETKRGGKPYFCPKCGDKKAVGKYDPERVTQGNKNLKLKWTGEELDILNRCIKGELNAHQVAFMIGRSINSVAKKVARVKSAANEF